VRPSSRLSFCLAVLALPVGAACAPEAAVPAVTPAVASASAAPAAPAPAHVATTPDEAFRATKPAPLANDLPFSPPVPVQRRLKNGAQVLVVENHAMPIVAIEVALQTGVDREPLDRRGLCGFVAQMLLEGTKTRSSLDIAIARDRLAAQLSAGSGLETTTVHLNALKDTLPDALAKVEKLRGVSYDLKENGQHEIGVIAEEVGAVLPEVVTFENNGKDARSVDYSRLTALLIEAVKAQQKQIAEQQQANKKQQALIHAQQAQISQLSQQVRAVQATLKGRSGAKAAVQLTKMEAQATRQ